MALQPSLRRGMTLIELLVVVAIMLTLIITVAPNLVNTAEARRSREAARMVAGFVAKAQSRALGRAEWSGMMLLATSTTSFAAIDMVLADVPPAYRGDTVPALLTITGSTATTRTASSPTAITSLTMIGGTTNDLIRLDGRGPYYQIDHDPTPGPAITGTSVRFEFRGRASGADEMTGFQLHNTPWPPSGVPLAFEVLRQPVPAGSPLSLSENRVVDLRWSGVGPPQVDGITGTYREFGGSGIVSSVSPVFDGTGRLRQAIVRSGATVRRITITGPLYLLVGRPERAGQVFATLKTDDDTVGANWQYPDSFWVAIDPMTGVAKTAECFPGAASVIDSQRWVRDALLTSGR
jgi:prepilin-type N-terminal cleavage/methylation domain-containing protein